MRIAFANLELGSSDIDDIQGSTEDFPIFSAGSLQVQDAGKVGR